MYMVTQLDKTEKHDTRKGAVSAAREMSESTRRPVVVEGENGESMTFIGGQLMTYTQHTRR